MIIPAAFLATAGPGLTERKSGPIGGAYPLARQRAPVGAGMPMRFATGPKAGIAARVAEPAGRSSRP